MRSVVHATTILPLAGLLSAAAAAHPAGPEASQTLGLWFIDPVAVCSLVVLGWIYWRGCRHFGKNTESGGTYFRRRRGYFWTAWGTLVIALASPLDPLGEELFSAHMAQHELIMLVAAPLLVVSRPAGILLRGLSMPVARRLGSLIRRRRLHRFWILTVSPPVAWVIHLVGLWGWHLPLLFEAGLRNSWMHVLQHISFLWVALIFWFAIMRRHQPQSAAGVLYLFTTAIHASLLGALLTFSPRVWYQPYLDTAPQWGLTALEDQQLGGLIMWMPAGLVFIAAALLSLARALRDSGVGINKGEATTRQRGGQR